MKTTKQTFAIYQATEFGTGMRKIKALSFEDAYFKLGEKEKSKLISILQSETGEEKWSEEFNYSF